MASPIYIDKNDVVSRLKPIDQHTHKGRQGHVLLIGGSYGKMGSVSLSAKAALKMGSGLVTAFIPECGYDIVQISIPEVMVLTDINHGCISNIDYNFEPQAIGIGPGLGQDPITQKALHQFLKTNTSPLVVDADALNMLAENSSWLSLLPQNTIVTPHQKELERLLGPWHSDEEKLAKVIVFSKRYDVIVVVKGSPTLIIDQDTIYENTTGNAALATAGTGDVLTGMITSLLGQSYSPINSAILAVYFHGLTASIALPKTGYQSFIASDIIANIGKAYLSIT
jgi:ADP-dependent NAD(P)H-hydrate dehydratase